MADKYILSVTAGPSYAEQSPFPVNTEDSIQIQSPHLSANLRVRIQNYRGLPAGSPQTSPYFSREPHAHDLYSLQFSFTPKHDLNGHDIILGNDFDHPIRDKLPPGFQQAFNIMKWFVDPGLYGDVHADQPYLFAPMLSSVNVLHVGPKDDRAQERLEEVRANEEVLILEEGGDADGLEVRQGLGIPDDAAGRKKHFLTEKHLKDFTFEAGREYSHDFSNPYLDFNDFALRLPGFGVIPGITIPIISYWDGQPLRYVLKNRATDEPLFVVIFSLVPNEHVKENAASHDAVNADGRNDGAVKDGPAKEATTPAIHTGAAEDDLD